MTISWKIILTKRKKAQHFAPFEVHYLAKINNLSQLGSSVLFSC